MFLCMPGVWKEFAGEHFTCHAYGVLKYGGCDTCYKHVTPTAFRCVYRAICYKHVTSTMFGESLVFFQSYTLRLSLRLRVRRLSLCTPRHCERNTQTTGHKDRGLHLSGFCGKTKTIRENPRHPFHPCSIAPLRETASLCVLRAPARETANALRRHYELDKLGQTYHCKEAHIQSGLNLTTKKSIFMGKQRDRGSAGSRTGAFAFANACDDRAYQIQSDLKS